MVRGDVRKDNQGFEDIDEFWADDDDFEMKDDDDDDDDYDESTWRLFLTTLFLKRSLMLCAVFELG